MSNFHPDLAFVARVFVPDGLTQPMPAMLWIHGGGFLLGSPAQKEVPVAFQLLVYPAPPQDLWVHQRHSNSGLKRPSRGHAGLQRSGSSIPA